MGLFEQIILAALCVVLFGCIALRYFQEWRFGWCVFYAFMAGMATGGIVRNIILFFS